MSGPLLNFNENVFVALLYCNKDFAERVCLQVFESWQETLYNFTENKFNERQSKLDIQKTYFISYLINMIPFIRENSNKIK